jgi:16S rRNA processing protein RimM
MSDSRKDFVVIGEVAKPHGVKGEVRVHTHTESPSFFSGLDEIWLAAGDGRLRAYEIVAARTHKGGVLLTLAGVEDRDAAEMLRGAEVRVPEDALPEPAEDEIYMHEVLGLEVRLPDGGLLGTVRDFEVRGDSEVWSVEAPDGREILLPVADEFIVELDAEARRAVADPPPGLLELYLGSEQGE